MRDNQFASAANRMDAIVHWIDGDGHNALLVGI
jgi:hypothetical protein